MANRSRVPLILFLVLFALSLGAFIIAVDEMVSQEEKLDARWFDFIKEHSTPFIINLCRVVSFFGSLPFILGAYVVVVIYLLVSKRKKEALYMSLTGIGSFILLESLKFIFQRSRPEMPLFDTLTNYSFPSGHAFYSFIFYSAVVLLAWKINWPKKLKTGIAFFLFLFVLAIGFSRIILRYHYSTDVLAGFYLGATSLFGFLAIRALVLKRHGT